MPEGKTNNIPAENPGRSDEVPAPEEVLAAKLAEQADAVTSELRDLLPESPAAGIRGGQSCRDPGRHLRQPPASRTT